MLQMFNKMSFLFLFVVFSLIFIKFPRHFIFFLFLVLTCVIWDYSYKVSVNYFIACCLEVIVVSLIAYLNV